MRTKTFRAWLKEHEDARERVRQLTAGLPRPYRRQRPRDPDEARFLREQGTPEHLIGPERR